MSGLIPLIIFWAVFSLIKSAVQNKQKESKGNSPMPQKSFQQPAPPVNPQMSRTVYEEEGSGFSDDEGCVGGSLPHGDEHEGSYVSGSLEYEPEIAYEKREPIKPLSDARILNERTGITPEQMRASVIMAEILGKPVALRKAGIGGRKVS